MEENVDINTLTPFFKKMDKMEKMDIKKEYDNIII
jgi:hypothetical protein